MAKFTGYTCDVTGATISGKPISLGVVYGRSMDAAGSMDDDYKEIHLSQEGAERMLNHLLKDMDYDQRQDLLRYFKIAFP